MFAMPDLQLGHTYMDHGVTQWTLMFAFKPVEYRDAKLIVKSVTFHHRGCKTKTQNQLC